MGWNMDENKLYATAWIVVGIVAVVVSFSVAAAVVLDTREESVTDRLRVVMKCPSTAPKAERE